MEAIPQETQKAVAAGDAGSKPIPAPKASGFPRTGRGLGFNRQDSRFSRPRGDGRFSQRSRGGFGRRDERERKDDMDSKLLDLSRVSHTRAGGRRLRFRAIVISGNKAGKVGLGVASGSDVAQAVEKATAQSKKNMTTVSMAGQTISHEVIAKVGPARVMIKPQKTGRGLIAGGVVRLICQLAGIKDISSKMLGTTKNKLNNARATIKAFEYLNRQTAKKATVAAEAAIKEEVVVQPAKQEQI